MHKQHPQTAYRKYAVLIGTIFENCDKTFFAFFFKSILAKIGFYGRISVKVHRQTRRKSATQSYRDPPGQPVASKKLLFLLSSADLQVFQKQELTKVNAQRYTDGRAEHL